MSLRTPRSSQGNEGVVIGGRLKLLACLSCLVAAGCGQSAGQQASDNANGAKYYLGQVCAGLTEVAQGITSKTITEGELKHKLDTMKSNADNLALVDPSRQDLDTAVQQLRAGEYNNDTSTAIGNLTSIATACGIPPHPSGSGATPSGSPGSSQTGASGSANAASAAPSATPGNNASGSGVSSAQGSGQQGSYSANPATTANAAAPQTTITPGPGTDQTAPESTTTSTTAVTTTTTVPPTPQAKGCVMDSAMVQPPDIYTSCLYGGGHENPDGTKGDSEVWAISWGTASSWGAQSARGTGTYYTGTGQGKNGADGPQWGVDIQLSAPQWVDNAYLFTQMSLTCDPSVPPPTSAPDTPGDCSSMSFTLPIASGQ